MNDDIIIKWAIKADNDFKTGIDEFNSVNPTYDTVCFHMQQCTEKYLKAFLIFNNKRNKQDTQYNLAIAAMSYV